MPTEPCADLGAVERAERLALLRLVLLQRVFEERALALYRQGRVPGSYYDGRGQEAVAAAAGLALREGDAVCPLNRELAVHFARGADVAEVFRNVLGRATGPTRGRDGNLHFGAPARGVFPLVSMLGDLVPVTVGAALAFRRRGERRVAMTFLGEGAFSVGDTHEGLTLAGVWQVPAVFVLQRNQFSYATPIARQAVNPSMAERIYGGWSIPCETVDGTDAVATYDAIRAAVGRARDGLGPQAVEAVTLRIHGHAAHDDGRYVPASLRAAYADRDPVDRLGLRLALDGVPVEELDGLRAAVEAEVAEGLAAAEIDPAPDPASLTDGVWAAPPPSAPTAGHGT
ncbi:MAG: thiamine pyrophosphate-dependent dehydrogenase E1 component subunit alpha [Gaiella sp.]